MAPQRMISLLLTLFSLLLANANANSNAGPRLSAARSLASRHRQFASRDLARHRFISHRPRRRRIRPTERRGSLQLQQIEPSLCETPRNSSIRLPLYSAADFGVGEYLAELELGTPPRRFKLFADTGSDLTWVKCEYRSRGRGRMKRRAPVFQADRSASFKTVPCGSRECSQGLADLFSLTTCPFPSAPCLYNYSYQSNSLAAFGIFGTEIATLPLTSHNKVKLPNIIGCTRSTQGSTLMNGADGVLGLSYSKQSFAYRAARKYGGGKFSYCLVDHLSFANVTNYLVFGEHIARGTIVGHIRHTRLFLHAFEGFYSVDIKGISIGGSMLDIPPMVWDLSGPGGAIFDSGTSLTVLATPAYGAVMDALTKALSPQFPILGEPSDLQPFGYCFNSTGFKPSIVPRLEIHFMDGARFRPHVKSYIIDDEPNVKCIGILESPGIPYLSILGNILQQNYFWEYDLFRQRLSFGASTCSL